MDDKMIAWDSLKDAKHLSEIYTGFATEVACEALLQDTIKIGQDHVRANHDIYNNHKPQMVYLGDYRNFIVKVLP